VTKNRHCTIALVVAACAGFGGVRGSSLVTVLA
jgi:hypothetical protein